MRQPWEEPSAGRNRRLVPCRRYAGLEAGGAIGTDSEVDGKNGLAGAQQSFEFLASRLIDIEAVIGDAVGLETDGQIVCAQVGWAEKARGDGAAPGIVELIPLEGYDRFHRLSGHIAVPER
ncbi:MAG: hypothetical protein EXR05_00465 [Acetobacteraceae bacterium]|nr:hypothetical protein [Acetobacteraceae bacterium]MSP30253.1 hypothetical protein [Acetobacteraceae bacterium]